MPPSTCALVSSSFSTRRAQIVTSAPASARPVANATPSPDEAPVTIATFPASEKQSRRLVITQPDDQASMRSAVRSAPGLLALCRPDTPERSETSARVKSSCAVAATSRKPSSGTNPASARRRHLVTLVGQRTRASRLRRDDHAVGRVDDRLVLLIPPNAVVLVAWAAEQLDDLSAPGRLTMQSARFDAAWPPAGAVAVLPCAVSPPPLALGEGRPAPNTILRLNVLTVADIPPP